MTTKYPNIPESVRIVDIDDAHRLLDTDTGRLLYINATIPSAGDGYTDVIVCETDVPSEDEEKIDNIETNERYTPIRVDGLID